MNDFIQADRLTEGDLIRHRGELLKVYTEPTYTRHGIEFDALPLDVTDKETQPMCLQPKELIEHADVPSAQRVDRACRLSRTF